MATFISQRDQAITDYSTLIYPNSVGAIDGQVHQDSGVGQLESVYQNLVGYDNYAYVIVRTGVDSSGVEVDTWAQNGANLVAAYNSAKLLTPGGNALSATNRVAVFVPPGRYDLGANFINANTEFVDLIGLGDSPSDCFINGVIMPGTLFQSANDIVIKGVTLKYSGNNPAGVAYDTVSGNSFSSTKMENVILDGNSVNGVTPLNDGIREYNGTYKNVRCVDYSGAAWDDNCNGVFIDCHCEGQGFAANTFITGGNMTNCSATQGFGGAGCYGTFKSCKTTSGDGFGFSIDCNGEFTDCSAALNGFGRGGLVGTYTNCSVGGSGFGFAPASFGLYSINATCINCSAGDNSFGFGLCERSGLYKNCTAGNNSFGDNVISDPNSTAIYENCIAGNNSFCYGFPSAKHIQCRAGDDSFRNIGGYVSECIAENNSFQSNSATAVFKNCVGKNSCFNGILQGEYDGCKAGNNSFTGWSIGSLTTHNAKIYGCTAGDYSFMSFKDSNTSTGTQITFTGVMKDCIGGRSSFGGCYNTGANKVLINTNGHIDNCKGGDYSFYGIEDGPSGSQISGTVSNCIGGEGAFAGNGGEISFVGSLVNCHLVDSASNRLGVNSWGGVLEGTMENCCWKITGAGNDCLAVGTGAKVRGCTLIGGVGGASVISSTAPAVANISMAHCRMNVAMDSSVTNAVVTPYNVVDVTIQ